MNRSNVTVIRKERRRDRRRQLQIEVLVGGQPVQLTDLSAAGFGAAMDATDRQPRRFRMGERLPLELRIPGGEGLTLPVQITRPVGENGVFGGVFIELSDSDYRAVESLLTGRFKRRR